MYDHIYVYAICYIYPYAVKTHTHKTPHVGAGGVGGDCGFFFQPLYIFLQVLPLREDYSAFSKFTFTRCTEI